MPPSSSSSGWRRGSLTLRSTRHSDDAVVDQREPVAPCSPAKYHEFQIARDAVESAQWENHQAAEQRLAKVDLMVKANDDLRTAWEAIRNSRLDTMPSLLITLVKDEAIALQHISREMRGCSRTAIDDMDTCVGLLDQVFKETLVAIRIAHSQSMLSRYFHHVELDLKIKSCIRQLEEIRSLFMISWRSHGDSRRVRSSSSQERMTILDRPPTPPAEPFNFADFTNALPNVHPSHDHPLALNWSGYIEKGSEIGCGNYADVFEGVWTNVPSNLGRPPAVAVKVLRWPMHGTDQERDLRLKKLTREVTIWQKISHRNVLRFIGVVEWHRGQPSFVSLKMDYDLKKYLFDHPTRDRHGILLDVGQGIKYLHSLNPAVIHGDVKVGNILVNRAGEACVGDFGLSRIVEDTSLWRTDATHAGGTLRCLAPELLLATQATPTKASDVYAYAMTSLEIISGNRPFSHISGDGAVIQAVVSGRRPERPTTRAVTDAFWHLWCYCWCQKPSSRMSMSRAVDTLEAMRRGTVRGGN